MNKKRICFISLGNLYLCPYISKYISLIECDYDVIYWDRHGVVEDIEAKQIYSFKYKMDENASKLNKATGYLKFRKYALNIINNNNYDGIILLQTSVGILLHSILKNRYKKKYIVDIRDYTMENNSMFFAIEKSLIKNSIFTVISSKGYKSFLPSHDYIVVHNDTYIDQSIVNKFKNKGYKKDKLVISYIGLIRFHEQNKKVIMKFKNDSRFVLRFIGKNALSLKEFCKKNSVNNVELIDMFPPEKTLDYYYETDIINNLYGNNTPLLDYALSNKLYYAAKLKIPILVCPNTYMESVSTKYGFGLVFNLNDTLALDKLYKKYININWELFIKNSDAFIREINEDNKLFENAIKSFINKI